jgi:eukaryotic-like serine/threonine-protein kinase
MAPEQAMGLMPLDNRVDIYSLAAVTYAMLTSRPPFLVRSIADIVARDPLLAPEPIASRLGAPSTLDGLLLSGLATDRNRRPPTALLLAQGLEAIGTEMQPGGTSRQRSEGSVITHAPPRREPSRASGFEPPSPYPAPVGSAAYQPSPQPIAGRYLNTARQSPSQLTRRPPEAVAPSRPVFYYVLLGVSALALFAISMFLTILVLR